MRSDDMSMRAANTGLPRPGALLRPIAEALDGLGIGVCVFDDADGALLWNRSFLQFFPEHAAEIHVGEPYVANLRRFYKGRLSVDELPLIDRYIQEGVARHHAQQRPYAFEHRGIRLCVSSLPLPGLGRIRMWKQEGPAAPYRSEPLLLPGAGGIPEIDGTALFDHVPDGVMVCGVDDAILWVNGPFVAMYGLKDRQAAVGLRFEEAYRIAWQGQEEAHRPLYEEGLGILNENMRFAGAPFEVPLPEARWSRVIEQRSPDGTRFFAHVDITTLKRQQAQLLLAERRARESEMLLRQKSAVLETTFQRMEQGIVMVNAQGVVEVCNDRFMELLNIPKEFMATRPTFEQLLAYQRAQDEFTRTPPQLVAFINEGNFIDRPHRYDRERPNGRVIEVCGVPIEGGGMVRTYSDITERKRNEERIHHLARHDGLTALINRTVFLEHLACATQASARTGEGFAVHYIDIDDFKPINDRFGHAVGDKVLALAAGKLDLVVGDDGVVARMGGDEFAVLQYRVAQQEAALALAGRLLGALREPLEVETHPVQLNASIGIALCPDAGSDADVIIRQANAAMYAAKASQGGGVRLAGAGLPPPKISSSASPSA